MHSKNFEKVKKYYEKGYWPVEWVHEVVGIWITKEEYKEITGYTYPDKGDKKESEN